MNKRLFVCLLTLVLALSVFSGCAQESFTAKGGTLYLTVNPVIAITYDEAGCVTSVTAVSDDAAEIVAAYRDYVGKDCTQVVSELVEKIGEAGYLAGDATISITFDEDAGVPSQDFAAGLQQQIEATAAANNWGVTIDVAAPVLPGTATSPSESEATLPEGAQVQADGSYIIEQYVNMLLDEVAQDKASYRMICTYRADGTLLSVQLVTADDGIVQKLTVYTYDNELLSSVTTTDYTKKGEFKECTCESFDNSGIRTRADSLDENGSLLSSAVYTYHTSGQISSVVCTNAAGITIAEQVYYEDGQLQTDMLWYEDGTKQSLSSYDSTGTILSTETWYSGGTGRELLAYSDGVLFTKSVFDQSGTLTTYLEYWPNGYFKIWKYLGWDYNYENTTTRINGWCVMENSEDGVRLLDARYWEDGSVESETQFYPSGNMKSWYMTYPSDYHSAYYGEYRDGESSAYTGWNIIDGEKVYFGEAAYGDDAIYDEFGRLVYDAYTENGHSYEVTYTYKDDDSLKTQEIVADDGSTSYIEYGYTASGSGTIVYSEYTGSFCGHDDRITNAAMTRCVFDMRGDTYHYEYYFADGSYIIDDHALDTGHPYYSYYSYADGRCEIYEYDSEGISTYIYIECEDGSVIEIGTPRG